MYKIHEEWVRDDSWAINLIREPDFTLIKIDRVPLIVDPRPYPMTYKYAAMAMEAHGYYMKTKWWVEE